MATKYVPREYAITTTAGSSASLSEEKGTTADKRVITVRTATDDGFGAFIGGLGAVDYVGKSISIKVVSHDKSTQSYKSDHEDASEFGDTSHQGSSSSNTRKGGEYATAAVGEEMLAGSSIVARYRVGASAPTVKTQTYTPDAVVIDLCPYTSHRIVPGSVRFTWMDTAYEDFEGVLYRDRTELAPGIASGIMDYSAGHALMTDYVVGAGGNPTSFSLQSLWTQAAPWTTATLFFRTQAAPVKPTGVVLTMLDNKGNALTATGDLSGNLLGAHMLGRSDYLTGMVELQFGDFVLDSSLTAADKAEWWYNAADVGAVQADKVWRPWPVDPSTLRYNSVTYFYLPIDAEILGLDPVRLPQDGRVPIYRVGGYVVVGHTASTAPATLANSDVVDCGRERLSRVRLVGSNGSTIHTGYTADLDAGTVTVVDNTGWSQPVTVQHRIEDLVRVSDVQIDGTLTFTRQLSHNFPLGSIVSSAIMTGTLYARVSTLFDQATWSPQTWADAVVGAEATATYNTTLAPVEVTNAGALPQRWVLRFTNSSTFECIGENVGNIGTGSINADYAPVNPIAGVPYFTLRAAGWGSGWAVGNIVRMNTIGALYPYAVIRTVQPGPAAGLDYSFELLARGDVDRPPAP